MEGHLEVHLLGSIEVLVDGHAAPLGAGIEQALVALLALNANRPVSTESIVYALWGERPPASAREMVRTYIARVRKHLGDAVRRQPGGYVLEVSPDAVDAIQFQTLCAQGMQQASAGDARAAAQSLSHALALWREPRLPELDQLEGARDEVGRLEELRLAAIEKRTEVELELGNASALVPELEGLVRTYPYRERLRWALMLALYRSGRQTDALERYLEGRRTLIDDVGIEPGRELQALHQAILNQDPALDLPSPPPQEPPPRPDGTTPELETGAPRSSRARVLGKGALAVLVAVAVALVILEIFSGPSKSAPHVRRETLVQLDPARGTVLGAQAISGVPGPIAVGERTVWVGDGQNRSVVLADPNTLRPITAARLGTFPYEIATDGSVAWTGDGFYGTVTVVDSHGDESAQFRPEPHASGRLALAFGSGAAWIGSQDGALTELDPRTRRTIAVIHGAGAAEGLAVGAGSVWIAEANEADLRQVNPITHRVSASIPLGGQPSAVAVADGSIWAVTPAESRVWRVDPRSRAVTAAIAVAPQSSLIAAVGGKVWIGSATGTLQQLDPSQNAVVRTLQMAGPIGGLTGGHRRLWVSVR